MRLTENQFHEKCGEYGFKPQGFMGYYDLGIDQEDAVKELIEATEHYVMVKDGGLTSQTINNSYDRLQSALERIKNMKPEQYQTTKTCKCQTKMVVAYDIQEKGWQIDAMTGCYLNGRGSNWPNSVRCSGCSKVHRLETFKRIQEAT